MATPQERAWHFLPPEKVVQALRVNPSQGLSEREVALRLARYGPNTWTQRKSDSLFRLIIRQLANPLMVVLVGALVITLILQEWVDAVVITLALLINTIVGTLQEWKASEAFEALQREVKHEAIVRRNGSVRRIPAEQLVPGDIVLLKEGAVVPADCRLLQSEELRTNESSLTGEWMEVAKDAAASLAPDTPLAEQATMVWAGTTVTQGTAEAVVVATGMETQMGRIASLLTASPTHTSTPLTQSIRHIALFLSGVILLLLILLLLLGLWRGFAWETLFLTAVAIAVAAIPQGLPAAVTITLVLGMRDILRKRGLVRNLLAAETLGSTSTILTDKTGTLTQAKMELKEIVGPHSIDPAFSRETSQQWILKGALAATDAFLERLPDGSFQPVGRPLERAILAAGVEKGVTPEEVLREIPRLDEIPFRSSRRFRTTLHTVPGEPRNLLIAVGAPEVLLDAASSFGTPEEAKPLTDLLRQSWHQLIAAQAREGKRVVAVAFARTTASSLNAQQPLPPHGVTFGGLLVFEDPLRPDVPEAMREVVAAGVTVIMATGDNPATAQSVALQAGIPQAERGVVTGPQVDAMDDDALREALATYRVFARTTPEQKLRMVRLLQQNGEVVAMTGDGVNDAPALQQANIGVAVGSGTEVAKAASDLVLLDDSFRIIVDAIRIGRRVMDNIKKIVIFLISTNFSGISLVGASVVAGTPLPILARQLLWTNIVEEGLMSFAYAFEPEEHDVMRQSPKSPELRTVLTPQLLRMLILIPFTTSALLIALYFFLLEARFDLAHLRSIIFVALTLDSLLFAFSLKSLRRPLWRIPLANNRFLLVALAVSSGLLLAAFLLPPLRTLLSLTPLTGGMVGILILLGVANLAIIEMAKYYFVLKPARQPRAR